MHNINHPREKVHFVAQILLNRLEKKRRYDFVTFVALLNLQIKQI